VGACIARPAHQFHHRGVLRFFPIAPAVGAGIHFQSNLTATASAALMRPVSGRILPGIIKKQLNGGDFEIETTKRIAVGCPVVCTGCTIGNL
jgi:hypothetical protein